MSVAISLFLEHDRAFAGEHLPLRMLFSNLGEAPITVPDPERSVVWPRMVARDATRNNAQTVTHRTEIESLGSHEFQVKFPERFITLGAYEQVIVHGDLLAWVPPLAPGVYDLAVWLAWDGGQAISAPVRLTVDAPRALATAVVYGHAGVTPNLYVASVYDAGDGATLVLGLFSEDAAGHGHLEPVTASRIAPCDGPAQPMLSVSANGLPYPAHWIAWFDGERLRALFERQGRVSLATREHLHFTADARFAAPLLLDLEGNDGSVPGNGLLAWWSPSDPTRLSLDLLDGAGDLRHTADARFDRGALSAVHAWLDAKGAPTWLALTHDDWALSLSTVDARGAVTPLGETRGRLVASTITLLPDGTVRGATVLLLAMEYGVPTWGIQPFVLAPGEGLSLREPQKIPFENVRTMITEALVAVAPTGDVAALLRSSDGRWWIHPGHGEHASLLTDELPGLDAPHAITWTLGGFHVVTVTAERGIACRALHAGH